MIQVVTGDAGNSFERLQELVLICRPFDPISFAVRFFQDELDANVTLAHSYHCLPYLPHHNFIFRSNACTVFVHELSLGGKDTLDGSAIVRTVQKMKSDDLFRLNVEDSLRELFESFTAVDFDVFVAAIRLSICCNTIILWTEMIGKAFTNGVSPELGQIDTFIKRQKRGHLVDSQISSFRWVQEDEDQWKIILEEIIDEFKHAHGSTHQVTFLQLGQEIIRRFVVLSQPTTAK